ncbi:NAD-dependent epimerase/dehydratase family protein [Pyramidobacter sp. YE332]|uniref:NAD-dependent epimerase/dehydratase family protein n=1 Tax=Pyramidobacter sp. YE332 TaxID=3068894 RepID=UPI00294B391A|nr:NAD-dependent epimerase/dehydratase family protein [Pyramidobacter sp. YE332]WOL38945.1 NAD-dependent epimerase/dehydratase family protein [Pyramidobacter sp. YE332]
MPNIGVGEVCKNTVLITGASGYIGLELIRQLLEETDFNVLAVSGNSETIWAALEKRNVARLQCVGRSADFTSNIPWKRIKVVVNLAFARTEIQQSALVETLDFHKEVFLAVKKARVPAIMNISSQSVYGSSPGLHNENSKLCPLGSYALAKCASEILLETVFSTESETAATNIRLDSIAGNKKLLPTFVCAGIERKKSNL